MFKVLIAEDDLMTADMTEGILADHGYEVCCIARTVGEAVALGRRHMPELAVIDVWLANGGLGTEIVPQLGMFPGRLGVLYATGLYSDSAVMRVLQSNTDGQAWLAKPYRPADLLRSLEIVAEILATGAASLPFPHGFQVLASTKIALW
jgi:DNA-binding response OmpR family regulator